MSESQAQTPVQKLIGDCLPKMVSFMDDVLLVTFGSERNFLIATGA
jgi:hypothetical protein